MLMKRTITTLLVLVAMLLSASDVKAQSATSDRDKISQVVNNFLNEWDNQSVKTAFQLVGEIAKYDVSAVGPAALEKLMGVKTAITGTPDYQLLFNSKLYTGHFTVVDNKWVKESDADDLQFSLTTSTGQPCVLTISTSGAVKQTSLPVNLSAEDAQKAQAMIQSYAEELGVSLDQMMAFLQGVKLVTFEVPERTNISVKFGPLTLMESVISIDHNSLTPTFSGILVNANTKFTKMDGSGTFELNLNQSGYTPNTGLNFDFSAKKNNSLMFAVKANVAGSLGDLSTGEIDLLQAIAGIQSVNVEVDVLGQAQLKAGVTNVSMVLMNLMALDSSNEEAYKSAISMVAQNMNVNLYYDNSTTPAATLVLTPAYDEEDKEWTVTPGIHFASDNSTQNIKEFFSAENFPDVLQGVTTFVADATEIVQNTSETLRAISESIKTGVDAAKSEDAVAVAWYTIDGKPTTAAAKGLKIVRFSNGSVRKVVTE